MNATTNLLIYLDSIYLWIIAGSVGGIVLLGLGVLLYFTLGVHYRMKGQVQEIDAKFEYLHGLLLGQDAQYIKRIEMISQVNLVFTETMMTYSRRFKEIRDKSDSAMQSGVNEIRDLLADRNYKALKAALPGLKAELADFESKVNSLTEDLKSVVRPEEECRQYSLALKEKLRQTKQDYTVKQTDLALVSSSFEAAFRRIDELFTRFEEYVDSGHYEEAQDILKDAPAIIGELSRDLVVLPNLCLTVQSIVPDKINSLKDRFEVMVSEGYPLHMILGRERIGEMYDQLGEITRNLQAFRIAGAQETLDSMQAEIEDYLESFEREKEARVKFESEVDSVYAEDVAVEQKNIRLWNALPGIKKVYVIPPEEQAKVDQVKTYISKASATKRSLDTFIHSGTSQPFTVLVEKMRQLSEEAKEASNAIEEFDNYLLTLKSDCETAMKAVSDYYDAFSGCEVILRSIAVDPVNEEYAPKIDELYQIIDQIYNLLYAQPIDVEAVNALVSTLVSEGDGVIKAVKSLQSAMVSADAAILYANRYRRDFGQMNAILAATEQLYFSGDFETSYADTTAAIKRLHANE